MMGMRMPKTCWAVFKWQVINLRICCIWLVDSVERLLNAIGLPPGGSSTVHIYTQTVHRTTQNKQYVEQHTNFGRVRAVSLFASYTVAFALQLRKKHRKPQVKAGIGRYSGECPLLEFLWIIVSNITLDFIAHLSLMWLSNLVSVSNNEVPVPVAARSKA